jgi:glycosyltransferase involved in cell wall biosynthesis
MIESILCQTNPPAEFIIVDDGSTDGSARIASDYTQSGLRLFSQENLGAASARNRAISESSGSYVIFIDADDIVAPTHLQSLRASLVGHGRCVALSRWSRFHISIDEAIFPKRRTENDMSGVDWLLLDWANCEPMTQPGMIMIPRVLIDRSGGWNEELSLNDDFEFFARVISLSEGVRFAPDAKLYYRSGLADTLSGRKSPAAVRSAFISVTAGTSHLLAAENSPRTRSVCANMLKQFDYTYYPYYWGLRKEICKRVKELGGATCSPPGPPRFHKLRRFTGWKIARLVQRCFDWRALYRVAKKNVIQESTEAGCP